MTDQIVADSLRGIDRMGSVFMTLLSFRLAHVYNKETSEIGRQNLSGDKLKNERYCEKT